MAEQLSWRLGSNSQETGAKNDGKHQLNRHGNAVGSCVCALAGGIFHDQPKDEADTDEELISCDRRASDGGWSALGHVEGDEARD